ncbi:hypothetical protein BHYA_0276g00080 [Botrytis hyacinthi]|uniref:Major facilitator superfamily (MFS) profile domain-containing protein n=1 Tax=Botrytis hyacinthi TaxID=278943 RepID=A0A4Z1GG46_9HELO|nr:hypothetical protein BHYA_0276g00080 [Botrytis hyacinthi]
MASPAAANDIMYSVQAARQAFPQLSQNFVVMGHSQGGGAAWATAEKNAISPITGYLGGVAVSSVSNVLEISDPIVTVLGAAMATGTAASFPDFRLEEIFTPEGLQTMQKLQIDLCPYFLNQLLPFLSFSRYRVNKICVNYSGFRQDSELRNDASSSDENNENEKDAFESWKSGQPTEQPTVFPTDDHEDEAQCPSLFILIPLIFALMVYIFMIALDTNIIGTAIPQIVTQFHSLNDAGWYGWYGWAYLLTLMSFQPTYGRFYTHFNIKWLFISALVTFEVGSTIYATAPSSKALIIGRAISGMGASGTFSGGLTISHGLVRPKIRPLYISIVTSVYGIVAIAGPLLSVVFTDSKRLTRQFCFFLNLRESPHLLIH